MCVNMFLLPGSHAFAKPKSHSLMRCGRLESSSVLSSFRSLDASTARSAPVPVLPEDAGNTWQPVNRPTA